MLRIRRADKEDAERITELAYETYWDTFHSHPKNDPDDFADYMQKAFSLEQITRELMDEKLCLPGRGNGEGDGWLCKTPG